MSNDRFGQPTVRDPALDEAWRAASDESPSPQSDAAILAAARAEARLADRTGATAARRSWWTRWQPVAAAAGVAALAFALVQLLPREHAPPPAPLERAAREASALGTAAAVSAEADARGGSTLGADVTASEAVPAPDAWARRVEQLLAAGQLEAATAELRAFRARYPAADVHLRPAVRDWARSVDAPADR